MQQQSTTTPATRYCKRCDQHLPPTAFGSHGYCRSCYKSYLSAYKAKHRATTPRKPRTTTSKPKVTPRPEPTEAEILAAKRQRKDLRLQRDHQITIEDFDAMNAAQSGLCLICSQPQVEDKGDLWINRDKVTNRIRGLVCAPCAATIHVVRQYRENPERWALVETFLEGSESAPDQAN